MKKYSTLFLALILCLSLSSAFAAGLSGLGGGLSGLAPAKSDALPDPYRALDSYGELLQADYAFSADYICDAYVYENPKSTNNFIDEYTTVCRRAGYTVNATTVDGAAGYSIQNGSGSYALLVPNFNGQMLLLVQKGMAFDYQKRTNYATCVYNNREYELIAQSTGEWAYRNAFSIMFRADRAPFKTLTLYFPKYSRSGDSYTVKGQTFITGFEISFDNDVWLVSSTESLSGKSRKDAIDSSRDYAELELYTIKDTEDGILVEGCFNGRFHSGDTVFENFVFSAIIEP